MENVKVLQKEQQTQAAKKSAVGLIFALMVGYSFIYMDKSMIALAIIPLGKAFSLDPSQTGAIMSFFFLGYSSLQIPSGWLADRVGAKKILLISLGIVALSSIAFGMVSSLLLFCAIRCLAGFGHAGYPASCSKAVAENFTKEKRTFVQALVLSTSGIGGILAFVLGAYLINMDWRVAYYVLGGCFAFAFVCLAFFLPRSDEFEGSAAKASTIRLKDVVRQRNVVLLFVAMLLLNFLLYGTLSWIPSFLTMRFQLDLTIVSTILAVNALLQTLATLFIGSLLSRVFSGKERQFLFVSTALAALAVWGLAMTSSLPIAISCLFASSMLAVGAFVCIFTWPHKILDEAMIGSSIGVINTGGTLGGFLAPIILGILITNAKGEFTTALLFMAAAGLLTGIVGLLVRVRKITE